MAEPSAMRTHKTRMGYGIIFGVLRELLGGERPVDKITRDDCRRVQALLKRLPANARKLYPSLSLEQATERAALWPEDAVSGTVNRSRLHVLSANANLACRSCSSLATLSPWPKRTSNLR